MILTKDTFNTEDIIKFVNGNTNFTVNKTILEEWLESDSEEITIGTRGVIIKSED